MTTSATAPPRCWRRQSTLDGSVVGQCLPRHHHQEFLKVPAHLDREFPPELDLRPILDTYQTHKHAGIAAWLAKHARFHLHFTPTSSAWLNLVKRRSCQLTEKALRRGVFPSVPDLMAAIGDFLDARSDDPKAFVWIASIDAILEKVGRSKAVLERLR
ncbi:MAG TPA: transposase [Candidatus Limnocylindrales bacterium]|jgi:DDE superfamily endonuclease